MGAWFGPDAKPIAGGADGKGDNPDFATPADLSTSYADLVKQRPSGAPDITDPAVQAAYRAQVLASKSQTGRSSTFMKSGKSFLGD